jgi:hypothetical protein
LKRLFLTVDVGVAVVRARAASRIDDVKKVDYHEARALAFNDPSAGRRRIKEYPEYEDE